jgi:glucose-1-phosphate cytidylyltransferase
MKKPKVVILCGGRGSRLSEETDSTPKPLVEIGAKPILWHIMKTYAFYGFNRFVLCLGYKGAMIKEYLYHYHLLTNDFTIKLDEKREVTFHETGSEVDWEVTAVDTGLHSLKGARIKRIEKYIDTDIFMLTYGDGVADIDIDALLEFHKKHGKICTLTGVRPPSRFGDLVSKNGKVLNFTEKPQASAGTINGGFFVFNRKFFDYLSNDDNCDFEKGILEELAEEGQLMIYEHKGSWECMDTLREKEHLNNLWNQGKAFWRIWK